MHTIALSPPVGGSREETLNVRIPAATHKDLAEAIPERLVQQRSGLQSPRLAEDALEQLQSHPFPGTVRELENVLEGALTLCVGDVITAKHIKLRTTQRAAAPAPLPAVTSADGTALGEHLEEIERDTIVKAPEKTRYSRTAVAKLLGMSLRAPGV